MILRSSKLCFEIVFVGENFVSVWGRGAYYFKVQLKQLYFYVRTVSNVVLYSQNAIRAEHGCIAL